MPQKLESNWKVELGEDYENIHKSYLHNIGNLILTEFNSEIGNKQFSEKKSKLNTSSLNFRLSVINQNIWNDKSIQEHQSNMISWLLDTFSLPDTYKEKLNWNTKVIEDTKFSPLDNDAGNIVEGNKPAEIHIENIILKVNFMARCFPKISSIY